MEDPKLSRFNPLSRIVCFDDFDRGLHGWTGLIGNYEKTLDAMLPQYRDLRPPMLSNSSMWDTGSAGVVGWHVCDEVGYKAQCGKFGCGR